MEKIDKPATLAGRLAKISAEVGAVDKSGRNTQQGYNYIEYAEIAARARKLQDQYGVAIVPQVDSYTKDEVRNSKGGLGYHYLLSMTFRAVNTDDKTDSIEVKWVGEATDWGDKGINKAITAGVKYFIMRLYNISEKGEKEADLETPEQFALAQNNNHAGAQKPAQKPKAQIDFKLLSQVRAKLPTIGTEEELEQYFRDLKLPQRERTMLTSDFAKRRKEIQSNAADDSTQPEAGN